MKKLLYLLTIPALMLVSCGGQNQNKDSREQYEEPKEQYESPKQYEEPKEESQDSLSNKMDESPQSPQ